MIAGLNTTWCQVSDMNRAVAFYRDVLGLKPGYISQYWSEFELGNGKIALHHALSEDGVVAKPTGGWLLGLRANDLKALRSALEAAGAPMLDDYHDTPSGVVLTFADLDGNPIQAMQAGAKVADLQD